MASLAGTLVELEGQGDGEEVKQLIKCLSIVILIKLFDEIAQIFWTLINL